MMEMEKPNITCEESENGCFARFIVEPLEKGYGITLGNCMRRTLLSGLPGTAPIAIRIAGVPHEFSTIRGVVEDVVDIVLNLKTLALKSTNKDKDFVTFLRIRRNTPGEVTARDFEHNDEIEILNPDLHICTMDEGAVLDMDLMIGNGRGYVSNVENKEKFTDIDFIAMDSIFSPVKKVNFSVETARVGQNVNYDKLVLEVETNGTVDSTELVSLAGKILVEHINLFVDLCDQIRNSDILIAKEEDKQVKLMELPIEEMDLSVRSYNCLKRAGINTVEDLVKKSRADMLKVKNLTYGYRKSATKIFNNFSLELEPGRVYGLLGRNGAGKSTLIYLMTGLLTPESGDVEYEGVDVRERRPSTLSNVFIVLLSADRRSGAGPHRRRPPRRRPEGPCRRASRRRRARSRRRPRRGRRPRPGPPRGRSPRSPSRPRGGRSGGPTGRPPGIRARARPRPRPRRRKRPPSCGRTSGNSSRTVPARAARGRGGSRGPPGPRARAGPSARRAPCPRPLPPAARRAPHSSAPCPARTRRGPQKPLRGFRTSW